MGRVAEAWKGGLSLDRLAEAWTGLTGVVADREAEWWEAGSRGLTSGLPAGRNSV